MKFSANLGFLWTELPLPDAIRAAHAAGFDAVECHWPYDVPIADVKAALDDTGLPMLGLNTRCGDVAMGDNGLSALPDRKAEAQRAIEQAITYATAIGASSVHVMAGNAQGQAAHDTFIRNLMCATEMANAHCIEILIEPLNGFDAPGYFLNSLDQAGQIIDEVGRDNLKLMFDCYHVGRTEGDVLAQLTTFLPQIGHIQFASVPDRGPPNLGDVDYSAVFAHIKRLGWVRPLGAEYRPGGLTEDSLDWLAQFGNQE